MERVGLNSMDGFKATNTVISGAGPRVLLFALFAALALIGPQGYLDSRTLAGDVDPVIAKVWTNPGADAGTPDIAAVIALHMMGGATATAASAAATTEAIPDTRLDLQLQGIFASNGERLAGAVIAEAQDASGFYRIGDEVADGVTLHAVAVDSVVLRRGGALETLRYPEKTAAAETASRIAQRRVRGDNGAHQDGPIPETGSNAPGEESNQRATQLRERLQRLRQRSAE